jgi:hypothetical protein
MSNPDPHSQYADGSRRAKSMPIREQNSIQKELRYGGIRIEKRIESSID